MSSIQAQMDREQQLQSLANSDPLSGAILVVAALKIFYSQLGGHHGEVTYVKPGAIHFTCGKRRFVISAVLEFPPEE